MEDEKEEIQQNNEPLKSSSAEPEDENLCHTPDTEDKWFYKIRGFVYYILSVIEVLLAFRLVFKMLGARTGNMFVDFLYSITDIFILPFTGIFRTLASGRNISQFVFEPSTVIAMIVYAIIARGIINLLKIKVVGKHNPY